MSRRSQNAAEPLRLSLANAQRIVVKFGTRILVDSSGRPDPRRLRFLVDDLAALKRSGKEIILVTSGAIGAGMEALGLTRRPNLLPELQMCAAVGQSRLMSIYESLFRRHKVPVGQVLLTYDDLKNRLRHLNARNTMHTMLRRGIVPIVNENDVVAVDEIKVGDNDVLASLVTLLVSADALILLSTTDGLRKPVRAGGSVRVPYLRNVTSKELALVFGKKSELSVGGMASKLRAAQTAARSGALAVIADGRRAGSLARIFAGKDTGTLIGTGERIAAERRSRRSPR